MLSPTVVAIGVVLRRVPARVRSHLQAACVAGGSVTIVAIPLIARAGSQLQVKAILDQDYAANLTRLLTLITVTALLFYLVRVVREHRTAGPAGRRNDRQPTNRAAQDG